MIVKAIKTRLFLPDESLLPFLDRYYRAPREGDILVVTSKIVALSEGRVVKDWDKEKKQAIIKRESQLMIQAKYICLTVKDGMVMASAGIDESNGNGDLILLPKDSWKTAEMVRRHFRKKLGLKRFGVIITDSRNAPFRAGVTGAAIAYAGFRGLKDYRRTPDIFGRKFHFSRVDVADSLATAAVLCMGEGSEKRPLAVIKGATVQYADKMNKKELRISVADDMYGPLFRHFQ